MAKQISLHVGTSGYAYKEWKGSFYPADLPAKQMLSYYAERFDTVEANNTFYKLPTAESVAAWLEHVPAGFRFAVKAPQRITHFKRLRDCNEVVQEFLAVAGVLKKHLGPLFFQLPGNFKKDVPRLRDFLKLLPKKHKVAFEFRHESWFDDEVYAALADRNVALCVAEAEDLAVPRMATADWGYLRLRLEQYSDADLKNWIKWIHSHQWSEAFIYFRHEDTGTGPRFGERLLELAGR